MDSVSSKVDPSSGTDAAVVGGCMVAGQSPSAAQLVTNRGIEE